MPAFERISLLFLSACLWNAAAAAQAGASGRAPADSAWTRAVSLQASPAQATDGVRISLLTILPGSDIYSLWGHSAIRVVDPAQNVDLSYNYGTFDFETSFFVLRFLHGSLEYQLDVHDVHAALRHYRAEGRPVIEQVLELSSEQKEQLLRFLQINARPENRSYRYHFLFDNCSTRVRDAFETALDGGVRFGGAPDPQTTFRQLIDPYQRAVPFLDAGIDWLLGSPVDRIALPYETMFLPDYLMQAFDEAVIEAGGSSRPLVVQTDTLIWIEGYSPYREAFPWEAPAAWLLLALGVVITVRTRGTHSARGFIRPFDVPLFLTVGLAGLLITYLWFISHHDVTEYNWHLVWAWPTHFFLGAAMMTRRDHNMPWMAGYAAASAVVALAAVAAAPIWPQSFHTVLVPIALLVALRSGAVFVAIRRPSESSTPSA